MPAASSDALALFGASGDPAHRKIFPTLQVMVKRGHLDAPVIGVAKRDWDVEALRSHVRERSENARPSSWTKSSQTA